MAGAPISSLRGFWGGRKSPYGDAESARCGPHYNTVYSDFQALFLLARDLWWRRSFYDFCSSRRDERAGANRFSAWGRFRNRPSGSHSASFCVPSGSNFGRSPNAASYIWILANLSLLNALAQSKSSPEVFCSKCTLWVPPLLLNLPTLISWPPDLQMMRAARRWTCCTPPDDRLLPKSHK